MAIALSAKLKKVLSSISLFMLVFALILPMGFSIDVKKAYATTYTITSNANSGAGTLRQHITDANSNAGADTILCDSGLSGNINLTTGSLPAITEDLTIDCSDSASQVTVQSNSTASIFNFTGGGSHVVKGFRLNLVQTPISIGSSVTSATIGGTGSGESIVIAGTGNSGDAITIAGDNVTVQNVDIQTNVAGFGIEIQSSADTVSIGSSDASGTVTITGPSAHGINIDGGSNVTVLNTTIDSAGSSGISIQNSASNITIGGTGSNERNYIYSNTNSGISSSSVSTLNIRANYIGVQSDGTTGPGNTQNGIYLTGTCTSCTVGGSLAAQGNVISGHNESGRSAILVEAGPITIQNNTIGLNAAGSSALANQVGVKIDGGSSHTISDNTISGNTNEGIRIEGTSAALSGITISDNTIGLNPAGSSAIANGSDGILITGSSNAVTGNVIEDNIISGNSGDGIEIADPSHTGTIEGNKIGTDTTGLIDLGNSGQGVNLGGDSWNVGDAADSNERNIISGNDGGGLKFNGGDSNTVQGNYIGLGSDGSTEVPNDSQTISISGGAQNNVFGGIAAGAENLLCADSDDSNIYISFGSDGGDGNTIRGNDVACDDFELDVAILGDNPHEMIGRPQGGTANNSYTKPTITSASDSSVTGTGAAASSTVDLYVQDASNGALYHTNTTADGAGAFTFSSLDLSSYTKVVAAYTDGSGNTSPSTFAYTIVNNTAPSIGAISIAQKTDGTGDVLVTITTLDDANDDDAQLLLEYSTNGADFSKMTLSNASTGTLDNDQSYQVQAISTASGAIATFTVDWDTLTDLAEADYATVQARLTTYDGTTTGTPTSSSAIAVDADIPATPELSFNNPTANNNEVIVGSGTETNANVYVDGVDSGVDTDASGRFHYTSSLSSGFNSLSFTVVDSVGLTSPARTAALTLEPIIVGPGPGPGPNPSPPQPTEPDPTPEDEPEEEPQPENEPEVAPEEDPTDETEPSEPADEPVSEPETDPQPEEEPEVLPEAQPEDEPVEEPTPQPEATPENEPVLEPETEPSTEPTNDEIGDSNPELPDEKTFDIGPPTENLEPRIFFPNPVTPIEVEEEPRPVIGINNKNPFTSIETNQDSLSDEERKTIIQSLFDSKFLGEKDNRTGLPIEFLEIKGLEDIPLDRDSDRDGLTDLLEATYGSSNNSLDSDNDGISDYDEVTRLNTNPASYDSDGDGISDKNDDEPLRYNPPTVDDSTLAAFAFEHGIETPLGTTDSDQDGLSDQEELIIGSNPFQKDSDGDGLSDSDEYINYGTDPNTYTSDLPSLRISNLVDGSAYPVGPVLIAGHGEANVNVKLYSIDTDGNDIFLGKTRSDEFGKFVMVTEPMKEGVYGIIATEGERNQVSDITPMNSIRISKEVDIALPEFDETLSFEPGDGFELYNFGEGQLLTVYWQSTIFSQRLVVDANSRENLNITPNEVLHDGDHTISWYVTDLETGNKSSGSQVEVIVSNRQGAFISAQNDQNPNNIILFALLILSSLTAMGTFIRKRI